MHACEERSLGGVVAAAQLYRSLQISSRDRKRLVRAREAAISPQRLSGCLSSDGGADLDVCRREDTAGGPPARQSALRHFYEAAAGASGPPQPRLLWALVRLVSCGAGRLRGVWFLPTEVVLIPPLLERCLSQPAPDVLPTSSSSSSTSAMLFLQADQALLLLHLSLPLPDTPHQTFFHPSWSPAGNFGFLQFAACTCRTRARCGHLGGPFLPDPWCFC